MHQHHKQHHKHHDKHHGHHHVNRHHVVGPWHDPTRGSAPPAYKPRRKKPAGERGNNLAAWLFYGFVVYLIFAAIFGGISHT